jgi:hypothetical protein
MRLVEGEISATSYKKLVTRLKPLTKKQLWDVLDHYIVHVITDQNADELLQHLDESALEEEQQAVNVAASAMDDDLFYTIDPKLRFRPYAIATVPTEESLVENKHRLELLYDKHCFSAYIEPNVKQDVANRLVAFASQQDLPVLDHWIENAGEVK